MADAATRTSPGEFKPHLFGKFFLLQRLAIGGMAEIYRARVPGAGGFEKELVVKRILPARSQDQGFIKMLVNEAKLTVQLTHSNIAQIYECGTIDGTYFISMELVNGVSMKEMMGAFARTGTPLSPEQAIYIVLQLLTGLDYAHKKTDGSGNPLQIVHCDVSPDNALVSFEGEVKLLDFGIARAATGLSNYKEGMLMGKLGYVAPEQASLETRWDHRVDIFAAGIVLYELLTKQKPFPRATDVESLVQARKARVVPPTSIDPRLPKDVDGIVARALAYDPDRRFPEARSFADALVDVLFPTPQSAIQDVLAQQMRQVFAEKIGRQRAARAHDPLIMKVLRNAADQREREEAAARQAALEAADSHPAPPAPPSISAHVAPTPSDRWGIPEPAAPARPPPRARPRPVMRQGWHPLAALGLAVVLGAAGAAGLHLGEIYLRDGLVVVTSEPPGAEVSLDGVRTGQVTPAVLEGVDLSRRHELSVDGPGLAPATAAVEPRLGRMVARVHVTLAPQVGDLVVESEPAGAEVRLDGVPAGTTPATLRGVTLDQRHRIDLVLAGHEIDQFVVLPEKDGRSFRRRLERAAAPAPPAPARP